MLILPPKYETKVFMPVPEWEWRAPSQAMVKDECGNDVLTTRFSASAVLDDGHVAWRGWFESRDDFDAFAEAIIRCEILGEPVPMALRKLPTPEWNPEYVPGLVRYLWLTSVNITSTSASTQSYSVPSDWGNITNYVQLVSHGGTAGRGDGTDAGGGGGSGGYAKKSTITLTAGGSATYMLKTGGSGTADADATWFNGANLAASSAGIRGGATISGTARLGAAGAVTTNAIGDTTTAGAAGGNGRLSGASGGGGGGPPGPSGAGAAGVSASSSAPVAGGAGDGGTVAAPSTGANGGQTGTAGAGFGTIGPGSGGNGANSTVDGGAGGNYGGGGGGTNTAAASAGAGKQGAINLSYTPAVSTFVERGIRGVTRGVVTGSYH